MLKKTVSILAAFVFGLVISISILACAEDISGLSGDDVEKELIARVLALEEEVAELKNAKTMQNIGKYTCNVEGDVAQGTIEYDSQGRISKMSITAEEETYHWTCSYSGSKCTVTWVDDGTTETYTLANEKSRDFSAVNAAVLQWMIDSCR